MHLCVRVRACVRACVRCFSETPAEGRSGYDKEISPDSCQCLFTHGSFCHRIDDIPVEPYYYDADSRLNSLWRNTWCRNYFPSEIARFHSYCRVTH